MNDDQNQTLQEWPILFATEERLRAPFEHKTFDAVIKNPDGSEVFRLNNIDAPATWSERAVRVAASKYFVKKGAKSDGGKYETSVFDMVFGVAKTIAFSARDQRYFPDLSASERFEDDLGYLLIHQYGAFNSPVWFNVRLGPVYGIQGSGGNWAWDRATGEYRRTTDAYTRPQVSACFINTVEDNLVEEDGIFDLWTKEARLFKKGSGSGANYSRIREKDAPLNSGGTSSGLMSFLPTGDAAAGGTKSGGTTRRAARMVCLDVNHPEVEAFVGWKLREERKAQALIAAGYTGGMDGEAYTTVSGQNANNSIRVTDDFMRAVEAHAPWDLTSRIDGRTVKTIKAHELWRKAAEAAWECGCPAVQYDTTINHWHTTPNAGPIRASNPCSEYMHLDDSACNLASLRLTKFVDPVGGGFNLGGFKDAVRTFIVAMDALVDLGSYPTKSIAKGAHRFRQLGLGYADLGAVLTLLGMPYDSDDGRAFAAAVTSLMAAEAYKTSALLAKEMGPFDGFAADREGVLRVISLHGAEARRPLSTDRQLARRIMEESVRVWDEAFALASRYGVRNAQVTVLAPTGTIGFLMDCETTGVEPLLAHVQYKTLAGGGMVTLVNRLVEPALRALGYDDTEIGPIVRHVTETGGFTGSGLNADHLGIFDTALPSGTDGRCLSVMSHLRMMAAVQPFLSGAISKTVNMPRNSTVEDVMETYYQGWKLGLKAVAIYRDGSKESQPVTALQSKSKTVPPAAPQEVSPAFKSGQKKLPKERRGSTFALKLDGHKLYLRTGEYEDGSFGELFVDIAKEGSALGGLYGMWAKAVSIGVQYGVPLAEYVETFVHTKFEPNGQVLNHPTIKRATSLVDLAMRVIGVKYLKRADLQHVQPEAMEESEIPPPVLDPKAYAEAAHAPAHVPTDAPLCPKCGTLTQRNGACHRCPQCGESLGCS